MTAIVWQSWKDKATVADDRSVVAKVYGWGKMWSGRDRTREFLEWWNVYRILIVVVDLWIDPCENILELYIKKRVSILYANFNIKFNNNNKKNYTYTHTAPRLGGGLRRPKAWLILLYRNLSSPWVSFSKSARWGGKKRLFPHDTKARLAFGKWENRSEKLQESEQILLKKPKEAIRRNPVSSPCLRALKQNDHFLPTQRKSYSALVTPFPKSSQST